MATYFNILEWRTPETEESGGLQTMGHKESDTTEGLNSLLRYEKHICLISNMGGRGR